MLNLIAKCNFANFKATRLSSQRRRAEVAAGTAVRRERSRGVTLLELVVVLFAIGMLLGLSLPIASTLAGRFKVGSARDTFVNFYARTRAVAVQYGREARLHMDAVDRQFWVEVDTGVPGAIATDTVGIVMNVAREYGGVTMNTGGKQVLCFDSRGLPFMGDPQCETHDAVIVFERASRADTVQVSLGGTVIRR